MILLHTIGIGSLDSSFNLIKAQFKPNSIFKKNLEIIFPQVNSIPEQKINHWTRSIMIFHLKN